MPTLNTVDTRPTHNVVCVIRKYTTLNAIYPPCVEPEAHNIAVGWHWNTHTMSIQDVLKLFVQINTGGREHENKCI